MLCYWQAIKSVPFTQVPTTINSICKRFYTTPAGKLYISNKHVTRFAVDEPKKKKKKGYRPTKKVFKYFLIHKPYNVLSQFTQPKITTKPQKNDSENNQKELKTLKSFFPLHKDVYPVGRLDSDSEGLLLLTNNIKGVTQKLLHPQQKHERTYLAQVEGIPTPDALKKLQEGVKLKEFTTLPAKVELLKEEPKVADRDPPIRQRKNSPTSWIKLILIEGKNRQVRRMTAAVGFPTLRLIRINFAGLELGELGPGKHRPLTSEETELLENVCKLQKGQRNTKIQKKPLTPEEKAQREKHNARAQEGRERKKYKENWWVELQKHYMTAKDHQDALFDQAKIAQEKERVDQMYEANDLLHGKKPEKQFDMSEHLVEEEEEEIAMPTKPTKSSKKKSAHGKKASRKEEGRVEKKWQKTREKNSTRE